MSTLTKVKADLQQLQKVQLDLCDNIAKFNKYCARKLSQNMGRLIEANRNGTWPDKGIALEQALEYFTDKTACYFKTNTSVNSRFRRLQPLCMVIFVIIVGICFNVAQKEIWQ